MGSQKKKKKRSGSTSSGRHCFSPASAQLSPRSLCHLCGEVSVFSPVLYLLGSLSLDLHPDGGAQSQVDSRERWMGSYDFDPTFLKMSLFCCPSWLLILEF